MDIYEIFEDICSDLIVSFDQIISKLYDNNKDKPFVTLHISVKNIDDTAQFIHYYTNNRNFIMRIAETPIDYSLYATYEGYDEVFFNPYYNSDYDVCFNYQYNNYVINIAFEIEHIKERSIIVSIAKVFTNHILSTFVKFLNHKSLSIYDFWMVKKYDINEDDIISKSFISFFLYHYNLNIVFISLLSAQKYESENLHGKILKPHRGNKRKKRDFLFKFANPINLTNNIREVRKIMELAKPPLGLIVNWDNQIIGCAKDKKDYECEININGSFSWEAIIRNVKIKYENGVYKIITENHNRNRHFLYKKIFCLLNDDEKNNIEKVIKKAELQTHGTIVVISDTKTIKIETNRLCKFGRGIKINKLNLLNNLDIINNLTSIDGAIMIDTQCQCYGIGVILDGEVVVNGNPARGSRYNSAINYIENRKQHNEEMIAVIISEDKTTDWYGSE